MGAPAIEGARLEAIARPGTNSQSAAEVVQIQANQRREQPGKGRRGRGGHPAAPERRNDDAGGKRGDEPHRTGDRLVELQREIQDAEHRLNQLAIEAREFDSDQVDETDAPARVGRVPPGLGRP